MNLEGFSFEFLLEISFYSTPSMIGFFGNAYLFFISFEHVYFRDGVLQACAGLQASDPSTWKTEARGFFWIWGKPELYRKTLFI